MKATVTDMRRNTEKIIEAIAREETVTLTHRGKAVATIEPIASKKRISASEHPAIGKWADREDMADPSEYVRKLRAGRFESLWL